MQTFNRQEVAIAYQAALRVPRTDLFESGQDVPVSLVGSVDTPYLGWVGRHYCGGTVLIAKNPGGGGDSQVSSTDHDLNVEKHLLSMRDSSAREALLSLDALTDAYMEQLPTIGTGIMLGHVLKALGDDLEKVAFFNVCPYRTRMEEKLNAYTVKQSIRRVAQPLLEALKPDTVVYLGVGVGRTVAKSVNAPWTYLYHRHVNDKLINQKYGALELKMMEKDQTERSAHRLRKQSK